MVCMYSFFSSLDNNLNSVSRNNQIMTVLFCFLFVPFLRFLFIFLMRSLSSINPSSYGLFRPKPERERERHVTNQSLATRVCWYECTQRLLCVTEMHGGGWGGHNIAENKPYRSTSVKMDQFTEWDKQKRQRIKPRGRHVSSFPTRSLIFKCFGNFPLSVSGETKRPETGCFSPWKSLWKFANSWVSLYCEPRQKQSCVKA